MKKSKKNFLVCAIFVIASLFVGCDSPMNSGGGGYKGGTVTLTVLDYNWQRAVPHPEFCRAKLVDTWC